MHKIIEQKSHIIHNENRAEYVGHIWSDIFSVVWISSKKIIIEIAPWWVNKIGHGLKNIDFAWDLYIIEPNKKALDMIVSQYKKELPYANIIPVQTTVKDAIPYLPKNVWAIVSNHPLDDMIMGKSLDKKYFDDFFDDHYDYSSGEKTRKLWEKLEKNAEAMQKAKEETIEDMIKMLAHTNPEYVIISQYESCFFKNNNIPWPDNHAYEVLQSLKNTYKDSIIHPYSSEIQDTERWMTLHLR